MKVSVFSSGSEGNCTLIKTEELNILIDAGITKKAIEANLSESNLKLEDISALFITHEHVDHVKAFPMLLKECNMTIYLTNGTYKGIYDYYKQRDKEKLCNLMNQRLEDGSIILLNRMDKSMYYQSIFINDIRVDVLPTFHDAKESVGYIINEDDKRLVYITDTGYVHQDLYEVINNCDAYILESNHDPEILMCSNRPYHLKIRIISDHGHMSNQDSMITLANVMGPKTKLVMHAHISQECNLSQIVEFTREKVFREFGICYENVEYVILQPRPSKEYEI